MSWELLPGDLIVLIAQYLSDSDCIKWGGLCKRFWRYRSDILRPSDKVIERLHSYHYHLFDELRSDLYKIMLWRDMPTVRYLFDVTIPKQMALYGEHGRSIYWWLQDHLGSIMSFPDLRNYFLHPCGNTQRMYQTALTRMNTRYWRGNMDHAVYLDAVNWRLVVEDYYNDNVRDDDVYLSVIVRRRNMSVMNYLYLQTYSNSGFDPVIARIIKHRYRPSSTTVFIVAKEYIKMHYNRRYQKEWETLLRLLLRRFPLSDSHCKRVKWLYRAHKDRKRTYLPESSVFPFDI